MPSPSAIWVCDRPSCWRMRRKRGPTNSFFPESVGMVLSRFVGGARFYRLVIPGLVRRHPRLASLVAPKSWMGGHRRAEATPFFERLYPAMTTSFRYVSHSDLDVLHILQKNNYDKFRCYMTSPFEYKPSIE